MEALLTEKEKIFPHQISCIVLVYNVCKTEDEENHQLARLCKKFCAQLILLLLDLIKVR